MAWLKSLPDDWWHRFEFDFILSRECIEQLNIELLFLVRSLLLETRTYARVCKRIRLLADDFQVACTSRNIHQPMNSVSNVQETNISIESILDRTSEVLSKVDKLKLTVHWLAIDGEQPIIPENPPRIGSEKTLLQFESRSDSNDDRIHPFTMNNLIVKPMAPQQPSLRRSFSSIPPSLAHELSVEQQIYFKILTETCFNGTDQQRIDTFRCLSSDAALQPLLPRLLIFIAEGIQANVHLHDLRFIIRLLSMLQMLTMNTFISFDKYLHSILPSLFTCLLCAFDMSKDGCSTMTRGNFSSTIWILREQASDLIYHLEKSHSTIPYLTRRIITILKSNLIIEETSTKKSTTTFTILYACIRTLIFIDAQTHGPFIIDLIRHCKTNTIIESDFDLDFAEQEILFDKKMRDLGNKFNLLLGDM